MNFSNKKCDISKLSDECQNILSCLKQKESKGTVYTFLKDILSNL